MHPAKRRRLDQSTSTLSKPFRSPLRVDVNKKSHPNTQNDKSQKIQEQSHNNQDSQNTTSVPHSASSPLSRPPTLPQPSNSSPTRPASPSFSAPPTRPTWTRITRSEYLTLQRSHTRLLQQLATVRKSLDTAQQALKIESSNQDAELEALIAKWRGVSREAAEELFRGAKDRVNKMGGLGAWRERTQKRDEAWSGGSQGSGGGFGMQEDDIDEDKLSEEQKEQLEVYRDEMRREQESYGCLLDQVTEEEREKKKEKKEKKAKEDKEDESFTMDMMLKQLNVDLDIIGYNAADQRWTD